jgi:hypothetical protein
MTLRQGTGVVSRSALAALAAMSIVSCGQKEPTTDAERLARGRELVQEMSLQLAAANEMTVSTTEVRDVVRRSGTKDRVSLTGVYTLRRPDRFHTTLAGGKGLESWYDGKKLTVAVQQEKVFAQAPMPENIDRTLDALAERYDMALPWPTLTATPPKRCCPTRRQVVTRARRTWATRPAITSRFATWVWSGRSGCPCRGTHCRRGSGPWTNTAPASRRPK